MDVRAASTRDALVIAEIHVDSWQAAYRGQVPDDILAGLSVDRRAEMWESIIAARRRGESVLVAEGDTGVLGFAHVCPSRDADAAEACGEISAIYVDPSAWGTGIGRQLMDAAIARLVDDRYVTGTLWVLVTNQRARRFYESTGWITDGAAKTEPIGDSTLEEIRYRRSVGP
jgi:GNAT superfamily N-acetyltransferase